MTLEEELAQIKALKDTLYKQLKLNYPKTTLEDGRKQLRYFLGLKKLYDNLEIEPYKARGAIAEVMLRIVCETWLEVYRIKGYYLDGIIIPKDNGTTTQLDGILITPHFIACIECKSYYGKVIIKRSKVTVGDRTSMPWTQNANHIDALKTYKPYLQDVPIINIVYFFSNGTIPKNTMELDPAQHIMYNDIAFKVLNDLYYDSTEHYNSKNLLTLFKALQLNIPSAKEEALHVQMINALSNALQPDEPTDEDNEASEDNLEE